MATRLTPYLNFREGTRAAMEYYRSVFGGELTVSTFGETPGMGLPESENDKVMHSMLVTEQGLTLMAADTPNSMEYSPGGGFAMSLSGEDEKELRGYWDKLVEGGTVTVPLSQAPWGDSFGMCTDRFGIRWLVNISAAAS